MPRKVAQILQDEAQAIAELESNNACAQLVAGFDEESSLIGGGTDLKSMVQDLKERAEPKIIERVLIATKWNCKTAAMQLKISYKALLYKMKKLGIEDKMAMMPAERETSTEREKSVAAGAEDN